MKRSFVGPIVAAVLVLGTACSLPAQNQQLDGYSKAVNIAYETCNKFHGGVRAADSSAVVCFDGTLIQLPSG
jgi:hypothetical protein